MARMRGIKPEFFQHEGLFDLEEKTGLPVRLMFVGLWTQADREGRLRWRPRQIKTQLDPYGSIDFSAVLDALASGGFIVKYQVDSEAFGVIAKFKKHQNIPAREPGSKLPPPPDTIPGNATACNVTCAVLDDDSTSTCAVLVKASTGTSSSTPETETETETETEGEEEIGNGTETESSFGFSDSNSLNEGSSPEEPDKPPTKPKGKSGSVFDWLPGDLFSEQRKGDTAYVVGKLRDWQQRASQTPPPVIGLGDDELLFLLAAWVHAKRVGDDPRKLFCATVGKAKRDHPGDADYARARLMIATYKQQLDQTGDPLAAMTARIGKGGVHVA